MKKSKISLLLFMKSTIVFSLEIDIGELPKSQQVVNSTCFSEWVF